MATKTLPLPVTHSFRPNKTELATIRQTFEDPPEALNMKFMPYNPMQTSANNVMLSQFSLSFAADCSKVAAMLYPAQEALLEWIRASTENADAFFRDPIAVIEKLAGLNGEQVAYLKEVYNKFPRMESAQP